MASSVSPGSFELPSSKLTSLRSLDRVELRRVLSIEDQPFVAFALKLFLKSVETDKNLFGDRRPGECLDPAETLLMPLEKFVWLLSEKDLCNRSAPPHDAEARATAWRRLREALQVCRSKTAFDTLTVDERLLAKPEELVELLDLIAGRGLFADPPKKSKSQRHEPRTPAGTSAWFRGIAPSTLPEILAHNFARQILAGSRDVARPPVRAPARPPNRARGFLASRDESRRAEIVARAAEAVSGYSPLVFTDNSEGLQGDSRDLRRLSPEERELKFALLLARSPATSASEWLASRTTGALAAAERPDARLRGDGCVLPLDRSSGLEDHIFLCRVVEEAEKQLLREELKTIEDKPKQKPQKKVKKSARDSSSGTESNFLGGSLNSCLTSTCSFQKEDLNPFEGKQASSISRKLHKEAKKDLQKAPVKRGSTPQGPFLKKHCETSAFSQSGVSLEKKPVSLQADHFDAFELSRRPSSTSVAKKEALKQLAEDPGSDLKAYSKNDARKPRPFPHNEGLSINFDLSKTLKSMMQDDREFASGRKKNTSSGLNSKRKTGYLPEEKRLTESGLFAGDLHKSGEKRMQSFGVDKLQGNLNQSQTGRKNKEKPKVLEQTPTRRKDSPNPVSPISLKGVSVKSDAQKIESMEKSTVSDKVENVERIERSEKSERSMKSEKTEKIEKSEKFERSEKLERLERVEKTEKTEKAEKIEKSEKVEKVEKSVKSVKVDKKDKKEKTGKIEKSVKSEKCEKYEKSTKLEKWEKTEKPSTPQPRRQLEPQKRDKILTVSIQKPGETRAFSTSEFEPSSEAFSKKHHRKPTGQISLTEALTDSGVDARARALAACPDRLFEQRTGPGKWESEAPAAALEAEVSAFKKPGIRSWDDEDDLLSDLKGASQSGGLETPERTPGRQKSNSEVLKPTRLNELRLPRNAQLSALVTARIDAALSTAAAHCLALEPARKEILRLIEQTARNTITDEVQIYPYGSYVTQILTPFSDLDVCLCVNTSLLERAETIHYLRQIADVLSQQSCVASANGVFSAIVPVLKIEVKLPDTCPSLGTLATPLSSPPSSEPSESPTLSVDLTIFKSEASPMFIGPLRTTSYVLGCAKYYPLLAPLASFVKLVLYSNGLMGLYKGGLNSYGLSLLVFAFIEQSGGLFFADLGDAFVKFCRFVGQLDPRSQFIYVASQSPLKVWPKQFPEPSLVIYDPTILHANVNVTPTCTLFPKIQELLGRFAKLADSDESDHLLEPNAFEESLNIQ